MYKIHIISALGTVVLLVHISSRRENDMKANCCMWAAATICPAPLLPLWAPKRLAPPSRPLLQTERIAVGSHGQYVPTVTAAAVR